MLRRGPQPDRGAADRAAGAAAERGRRRRGPPRARGGRLAVAQGRPIGGGRTLRAPTRRSAFLLGAGISAVELPTAFMYFGAVSAILGSHAALPERIALVVAYNALFVLPLVTVPTCDGACTGRARPQLSSWWPSRRSRSRAARAPGRRTLPRVPAACGPSTRPRCRRRASCAGSRPARPAGSPRRGSSTSTATASSRSSRRSTPPSSSTRRGAGSARARRRRGGSTPRASSPTSTATTCPRSSSAATTGPWRLTTWSAASCSSSPGGRRRPAAAASARRRAAWRRPTSTATAASRSW